MSCFPDICPEGGTELLTLRQEEDADGLAAIRELKVGTR
jgi:hypothetical protein